MNISKKVKPLLIVLLIIGSVHLIVSAAGIIMLFRMGDANRQSNEVRDMLLEEEAVWVDENNRYQILFSSEKEGGIIYSLESDASPICFYFALPGTIDYWEMDASNGDFEYAKEIYLGSSEFLYNYKTEALELKFFYMDDEYDGTLGMSDLTFYRKMQ